MKNINYPKQIYYILAFMMFLTGIVIYAFFRDINNMILFYYIPKSSFLANLYIPVKKDSILLYMLFYNLPDGLWCLSALLLIRVTWIINARLRIIYSSIFIVIALFYEFLQIFENIPGTFDPLDLLFIGSSAFLESLIFYLFNRRSII
ncbi:hypothetical protein [Treponema sp. R6D11]